ncbi:MAG: Replication-associated protein G2P [Desulfovibrionaceae bacterium]|nr:Replication-associated protein G2P [Desulfovibrionaceae bacterium]
MRMIDWITAIIPVYHEPSIYGGNIKKITMDGKVEFDHNYGRTIRGSHESSILVRTNDIIPGNGGGSTLWIDGNPTKFLQGHNIFGSDDLIGLVHALMTKLCDILPELEPTDLDMYRWMVGDYHLSRVDVAAMYSAESRAGALAWLRSAESASYMKHRGRGVLKGMTLYYGQHSRRWSLKAYSKGDELANHKGAALHENLIHRNDLLAFADDKLRLELVLRSMELKDRGLSQASAWCGTVPTEVHHQAVGRLEMAENFILPDQVAANLPRHVRAAYTMWKVGEDLRATYSKATYYRLRTALLAHGIDISTVQPKNNVVPLMRIITASPASIPDWAKGTPPLFERKSA